MGTTLRWASADLEVLHNDDKRYEIMVGLLIGNSGKSRCTGASRWRAICSLGSRR